MSSQDSDKLMLLVEEVLGQLHKQQCAKVQKIAQKINPSLTTEDLLNPDNFPKIISDPDFMYEDGIAAGILSAKLALRARLQEN